jgi:hypothetical protein
LRLEEVRAEGNCVDDAAEVDVQSVFVGLFWVAIGVEFQAQVVCARTDSGICKDVVDSAVLVLCGFEKLD